MSWAAISSEKSNIQDDIQKAVDEFCERYVKGRPTAYGEIAKEYEVPGQFVYKGRIFGIHTHVDIIKKVEKLQLGSDDVLVVSYPKTGTTLTMEIVNLVRYDADLEKVYEVPNVLRITFLEHGWEPERSIVNNIEVVPQPRVLKSHLPFEFLKDQVLDQKVRTVYVMRNPKDTLVSFFYFYKSNIEYGRFPGSWDEFFEMAMMKKLCFGDLFDHYLGWWEHRDEPNLLLLKYEDLVRHPKREVEKIAKFCGKDDMTDEKIEKIVKATSFKAMKSNPMTNFANPIMDDSISPFMRKGQVGDWKNHFTIAQNERYDRVIREKLSGTGLEFVYE